MQGLPEEDEEGDLNFGVIPEDIPSSTKPIEGNILKCVAGYVKKLANYHVTAKSHFLQEGKRKILMKIFS